ncbi:MAG: flagellar biosynthesis protein FliQ [Candidatus Hydrogenedentes bacterium]|nr:flagellar biosynthesis protein FliQ [Candidatus Hydrogenedentota bacterium]
MTIDDVTYIGQQAMVVTLLASAPMLIAGMVVGLVISVLQSVTQIQEITLTFVPKIVAVMVVFVIFLPFSTDVLLDFVRELFGGISTIVSAR